MTTSTNKMFICHSSEDKAFVNSLLRRLNDFGITNTWYDHFEVTPETSDFYASIESGIQASEYFVLVLSPQSQDNQWVAYEIQTALSLQKPVLAVVHEAPGGFTQFLANPHMNAILRGGHHKLIDFTKDFEEALVQLLLVVAPDIGKRSHVEFTLRRMLHDEDPDKADRSMSLASLDSETYLPLVLKHLPELRDNRRLRQRIERSVALLGPVSIDPLFQFLMRDSEPPPGETAWPNIQPTAVDPQSGVSAYSGHRALDYLRHIILTGGDRGWSAQLGAEYCLEALARDNLDCRTRILARLKTELVADVTFIASARDTHEFKDPYFDRLRYMIELAGLIGDPNFVDPFLIRQFASSNLWGDHRITAKDKLLSYVVTCLSRLQSVKSLEYLLDLSHDKDVSALYFEHERRPNPWFTCFVPFGNLAVDKLMAEQRKASQQFQRFILFNLSAIANPRSAQYVYSQLSSIHEEPALFDVPSLLANLARSGIPEICAEIVKQYLDEDVQTFICSPRQDEAQVEEAIAVATKHLRDHRIVLQACRRLCDTEWEHTKFALIDAIEHGAVSELYAVLQQYMDDAKAPAVRGRAAIALTRIGRIGNEQLVDKLKYAENDIERPYLGVALAYLNDPSAIPALVSGLQHTFLNDRAQEHELYASALRGMSSPEATSALNKWHMRI